MPENRDYITSADENGSISISEEVVSTIVALAVTEANGGVRLAGVTAANGEMPDRKNLAKALRITSSDSGNVVVELSVCVRYGEKIPALAAALQDTVEQAVESQAGLSVDSVNIHVVALDFSAQEAQ